MRLNVKDAETNCKPTSLQDKSYDNVERITIMSQSHIEIPC